MSIIIKLQGLPLNANSADVRRYFLGLTIPDGGVHIVGGEKGTVFIEFANDEDARQAMACGSGTINNAAIQLLLSSKAEMQNELAAVVKRKQQYQKQLQQQHQVRMQLQTDMQTQMQMQMQLQPQQQQQQTPLSQPQLQPMPPPQQQPQQSLPQPQLPPPFVDPRILSQSPLVDPRILSPSPFVDPRILSQNYQGILSAQSGPPVGGVGLLRNTNSMNMTSGFPMATPITVANTMNLSNAMSVNNTIGLNNAMNLSNSMNVNNNNNDLNDTNSRNANSAAAAAAAAAEQRARMSGMRGGDDKLFANKRCVLAASNIPYRATSKDIIEFLSEFNIKDDCIRRRYNQKGQPTADAKIAFPTPDAAIKALKVMNKKTLCGRPVFLKPV